MQPDAIAGLLPNATRDTAPFYEGLDAGRVVLQECSACGRLRYPIAPACPFCGDGTHRWRAVEGCGSVHSWVRYHRSFIVEFEPLVPYVVVTVQLDEGPRLFGRLVNAATDAVRIGDRVDAVIERTSTGRGVLGFTPAGSAR
jgi:uncharacterized OB-fold protein